MSRALAPSSVEAAFWLIITVGLAAGVGLELERGRSGRAAPSAEVPPGFAKPVLAEPFHLADPDQFLDVTLRPLFIVTRRPAPAAPTADSKPSMKKDQFILMGTSIVAETKFAFLLEKAGNRSRVVALGKDINGITVKEVAPDRVVLSQYDDTEVLLLKMNRPAPAVPAPLPFPPGAGQAGTPPAFAPRPGLPPAPAAARPQQGQPQPPGQVPAPAAATIGPR